MIINVEVKTNKELIEVNFSGNELLKQLASEGKAPEEIKVNGELFKLIVNAERANANMYYVSKSAKVYSVFSNDYVKPQRSGADYYHLMLKKEDGVGSGYAKKFPLHQIVAYTFLGERPSDIINKDGTVDKIVIHHIDGDYTNNNLSNLEYIPQSENLSAENVRRLNNEKAKEVYIRFKLEEDFNNVEIAREYGVSVQSVDSVINRKTYRKITEALDLSFKLAEQGRKIAEQERKNAKMQKFVNDVIEEL